MHFLTISLVKQYKISTIVDEEQLLFLPCDTYPDFIIIDIVLASYIKSFAIFIYVNTRYQPCQSMDVCIRINKGYSQCPLGSIGLTVFKHIPIDHILGTLALCKVIIKRIPQSKTKIFYFILNKL